MTDRFDAFVIFAEMRTGSNFLEANLNAFPTVTCHGEVFNPHFIGYPNSDDVMGITQGERDRDPGRLLERIIRASRGLGGFRYFHDHEPRVLEAILTNPRIAKIVLTRNPVESYVSWKIAQETGQWKLTNVRKRKETKARFEPQEFEEMLTAIQGFQITLQHALQVTGQTAFYVANEDLDDLDVMNGLAAWLGLPDRLEALDGKIKRQNPEPLSEKVENFAEMETALVRLDRFNLTRTPNFEPRRGPVVPSYLAAAKTPLLYMPIRSGPEASVRRWMAALDSVGEDALLGDFRQNTLKAWKEAHPGHRSFTVIRHPLARAYEAFCEKIAHSGKGSYAQIRRHLEKHYGMELPGNGAPSAEATREAFKTFLKFLKPNLAGQTPIRVDGHWSSQVQCLQGMAEFTLPDMIVREEEMQSYLPALALQVGHGAPPDPSVESGLGPVPLADIHDAETEALARDAYGRDYLMFGFGDWRAP
ncbi:sulfotransferase family 2 domain-containing protein [Litorisediminicola beolgyonensis]|uniref:Sulfotransferase family 2 domain-containing protein n=1 Tax=Litorisediminicola beolgyonensis TaxID=1173614 RepID=A0ABW3ZIG8_9RHOB